MRDMGLDVVHVRGEVYMIDAGYHGRRGVLGTYVVRGEGVAVVDPGPTASVEGVVTGLEEMGSFGLNCSRTTR